MKISELIEIFEEIAPVRLQENWDNSGIQIGNIDDEITGILLTLDITPEILAEAIENELNVIISHHPLLFQGLKRITNSNYVEKCVRLAIKNDISILSYHTNFDSILNGVSGKLADKLGLTNRNILVPQTNFLKKIVVFVPESHADIVRNAMFEAGAGHIGNYDLCSYNINGIGSFRGGENSNPYVGEIGKLHFESEVRIEMIFPEYIQSKVVESMLAVHPYEEVAYDIYRLDNKWENVGAGIIGELEEEIDELQFLNFVKKALGLFSIKHSPLLSKKIKKVALCGGSGASFIKEAISAKADVYITGDIKYHDYFLAEDKILLVDIGHYESEIFIIEKFYDIIMKKNPKFAVRISKINTNIINTF